jgi:hypothetical protein
LGMVRRRAASGVGCAPNAHATDTAVDSDAEMGGSDARLGEGGEKGGRWRVVDRVRRGPCIPRSVGSVGAAGAYMQRVRMWGRQGAVLLVWLAIV